MGRDRRRALDWRTLRNFNPRARVGRDDGAVDNRPINAISIHAPAWGATIGRSYVERKQLISIHAPAWGATAFAFSCMIKPPISIHAPAWGATLDSLFGDIRLPISIHAPAWGATLAVQPCPFLPQNFNPRARVGRDRNVRKRPEDTAISIHAPAWGATSLLENDSVAQ